MTPRSSSSNNNKPNGESTHRVAVVTGTSSGIGFKTALTLARNGFYTYATMRNLKKSTSIKEIANKEALPLKVVQLDVDSDDLSAKNAIQEKIISEKQRIDILVNNAGYGLVGPIEDISIEEELKAQFETNLYGVIRVTQQVLPIMRRQKSGRIINVSSIGGIVGYPFSAAYCSTKFALEGLSESLSYEVDQFGIKVILIEPALVISDFHNNVKMAAKKGANSDDSPYIQMMQKLFEEYKQVQEQYQIPAEEVAKVILNAAILDNPPNRRYLVGKYSEMMKEAKVTMSDIECRNMMKRQLLGSSSSK
jgi:NAD(P)-dependent dehydrogenase (short-subunit alcohol dehydrogenase family)